jgi:low temperature requirement protein LtrA
MRSEERVMPLELCFDLVFVLALTQCTAVNDPSWEGIYLAAAMAALILYENVQFAEPRDRLRHQLSSEAG